MNVGFAIIGIGEIGTRYAQVLTAHGMTQVSAVLALDRARGEKFVADHCGGDPSIRVYTGLKETLSDPSVQAVIIATPDRLHAEQCLAAAAAGRHIFVEKPMTTTVEDAARVAHAVNQHGVKLAVGYHHRWHAGHRLVRDLLASGQFGEVHRMHSTWHRYQEKPDWRSGPDGRWWSLAAYGAHLIDLTWWMLEPVCGRIAETKRLVSAPRFGGNDERASVLMRFKNGAIADVSVAVDGPERREFIIECEKATIRGDWTFGAHGGGKTWVRSAAAGRQPERELEYQVVDPYVTAITDLVESIQGDRKPLVDVQEGVRNVLLLDRDFV